MALWKKNISGQGDPPGPLGKYITMYNKAVKTLGTDNPEVLKRFFASQQYGQNNTQVQQNNNINKAPQPKESKAGSIAGDVGTLALSTLQNFGMNILGDVLKTVAPKAAILDVLPQTTTNQYVKQRNQSLGQNIKDVADATNTVAAFEVGAPLVAKGVQAGVKYASPYAEPIIKSVKNRLFKPQILPIEQNFIKQNFKDLQYAKDYYSKFGYDIPENLNEIAKSTEKTDKTIQGLVEQHNTFVRGVSTNWTELEKRNPEILRHLEGKGIDWKNNPQAAAEYMSTHVPIQTGYGRAGLNPNIFEAGKDAIYTSNSIPTAEGYTYGNGYIVKVRKPLNFNSKNRIDWIEKNKLDYYEDDLKTAPENIKKEYLKEIDRRYMEEIEPKYFDEKGNWKNGQKLVRELGYDNWKIEQDVRKKLGLRSFNLQNDMLKTEKATTFDRDKYNQLLNDLESPSTKLGNLAKDILTKKEFKILNKISYQGSYTNHYNEKGIIEFLKTDPKYKPLLDIVNEKMNYAHYLHVGTPGQKLLEPIESIKITPKIWKNKSRAHTNVYTKGLSAGVKLLPTTLASYGLYKSKKQ